MPTVFAVPAYEYGSGWGQSARKKDFIDWSTARHVDWRCPRSYGSSSYGPSSYGLIQGAHRADVEPTSSQFTVIIIIIILLLLTSSDLRCGTDVQAT